MDIKITKEQAYQLSLSKWKKIHQKVRDNWNDYIIISREDGLSIPEKIIEEISIEKEYVDLICACGYCHLYYSRNCRNCPLNIENTIPCFETDHPFSKFSGSETKEEALEEVHALINLIEQTHEI